MRGLGKFAWGGDRQTDKQMDIATLWLNWPSGPIQWKLVKKKVRLNVFLDFSKSQQDHSKVKNIPFQNNNKAQEYLSSPDFTNKLRALLFNLRCQAIVGLKDNFHNFYKSDLMCSMKCKTSTDSQSHVLNCPELLLHLNEKQKEDVRNVRYKYLFGNITEQ